MDGEQSNMKNNVVVKTTRINDIKRIHESQGGRALRQILMIALLIRSNVYSSDGLETLIQRN